MKKRGIQVFIAIAMVLCLLIPLFTVADVSAGLPPGETEELVGFGVKPSYWEMKKLGEKQLTAGAKYIILKDGKLVREEWRNVTGDPECKWEIEGATHFVADQPGNVEAGGKAGTAIITATYKKFIGKAKVVVIDSVDKKGAAKAAQALRDYARDLRHKGLFEMVVYTFTGYPDLGAASEADRVAEEFEKIAQDSDPPSEYTEVFQIRPRTLDPWLPEPTTSFDFAAINFINNELRVIEEMEALAVSLERQGTAYSVEEFSYYKLQMQAVLDYTNMLIADLTGLASSSAEFYEERVKLGVTVTPEDVISYQQRIATEGFSADELQILKEGLLATDEEIAWIKSEILSIDPVAQWAELESALPELDTFILSTLLPEFNWLASEAEKILLSIPVHCFIATAAYGTPMAEEIQVLREFRDQYLLTNPVGEALVEFYYEISPPMAEFINEHPALKPVVRAGLVPAIAISTLAVNTTLAQKIAIVSSLAVVSALLVIWLRKRVRGNAN